MLSIEAPSTDIKYTYTRNSIQHYFRTQWPEQQLTYQRQIRVNIYGKERKLYYDAVPAIMFIHCM